MKHRSFATIAGPALVVLAVSCSAEPELTPSLQQAIREEGSAATAALLHTLQENLGAALR